MQKQHIQDAADKVASLITSPADFLAFLANIISCTPAANRAAIDLPVTMIDNFIVPMLRTPNDENLFNNGVTALCEAYNPAQYFPMLKEVSYSLLKDTATYNPTPGQEKQNQDFLGVFFFVGDAIIEHWKKLSN